MPNISKKITSSNNSTRSTIRSTSVKCSVFIYHYPQEEKFSISSDNKTENTDVTGSVIQFTNQKGIKEASGNFTIVLANTINFRKICSAGDWVLVKMSNSDKNRKHNRVFGIVNRVSREESIDGTGKHTIKYLLYCSDFGKALQLSTVWWNPKNIEQDVAENFFSMELGATIAENRVNFSAQQIMRSLLKLWLSPSSVITKFRQVVPYVIPSALSQELGGSSPFYYDLLQQEIYEFQYGGRIINFAELTGTLWASIMKYSNEYLYEVFVEMRGDVNSEKPSLVFRPYPYSSSGFSGSTDYIRFLDQANKKGEYVEITGADIVVSSVGINDHDNYTGFMITAMIAFDTTALSFAVSSPIFSIGGIAKYGLRMLQLETDYDPGNQSVFESWLSQIVDFHANLNLYEEGSFRIIGNPEVRIGKFLRVKDASVNNDKIYYIIGYSDEWSYGGQWFQNINVIRGRHSDGSYPFQNETKEDNFIGHTKIKDIRSK